MKANSNIEYRIPNKENLKGIIAARGYDLEERTFRFASSVMLFIGKIPRTISNLEVGKQLARAGGSVGANYIEANESLGKKDFLMRIRICRKEAKESIYGYDFCLVSLVSRRKGKNWSGKQQN
jgi:four helix bundle protein